MIGGVGAVERFLIDGGANDNHTVSRPVSAIVMDLAATKQRIAAIDAECRGVADPEVAALRVWDELETRLSALDAEFDAAIFAATGVSWAILEGVRS